MFWGLRALRIVGNNLGAHSPALGSAGIRRRRVCWGSARPTWVGLCRVALGPAGDSDAYQGHN